MSSIACLYEHTRKTIFQALRKNRFQAGMCSPLMGIKRSYGAYKATAHSVSCSVHDLPTQDVQFGIVICCAAHASDRHQGLGGWPF